MTEGGGVYTWRRGKFGRLGHGDAENQLAPRRVPAAGFNNERVVMLAAGAEHTVALSKEGHVFTWGLGRDGQLGHGDGEDQQAPRQVEPERFGGERVVFVAAGGHHTVAVTAGGRLYTWGYGGPGELGHGDPNFVVGSLVPVLVGPAAFMGGMAVMAACGEGHTLVVTHDGALWSCGWGAYGRLGDGNEEDSHLYEELDGRQRWRDEEANKHAFERVGAEEFEGARVVAAAAGISH